MKFRLSPTAFVLRCGPAFAGLAVTAFGRPYRQTPSLTVFQVLLLVGVWRIATSGADARPDGLYVRGLRRRLVPWQAIHRIDAARMFGGTYVTVAAGEDRFMLYAPQHTGFGPPDRRFVEQVDALRRYWSEAGG